MTKLAKVSIFTFALIVLIAVGSLLAFRGEEQNQVVPVGGEVKVPDVDSTAPTQPEIGDEVVVKGLVIENYWGCIESVCRNGGPRYVRIRADGEETKVVYHYGKGPRCLNNKATLKGDLLIRDLDEVEVFGKFVDDGTISTCDSLDYYIKVKERRTDWWSSLPPHPSIYAPPEVEYEDVVKLLYEGKVASVRFHNSYNLSAVTVTLKNGTELITVNPTKSKIVQEIERCGELCKEITITGD